MSTANISLTCKKSIRFPAILAVLLAVFTAGPACLQVYGQTEDGTVPAAADAVELFNKGQDAHEKGQLVEAVALYERAIAALVDFPEAEYQRGNALLSLGRKEEAEKAFRRAVQIRPEWTLALASLGSVLVSRGAYTEAEPLLQKAISLDDQNALALSALAELRINTKSGPASLRQLLAGLTAMTSKANPTAQAWAARGAIEAALGDRKAARASFDRALQLDPYNLFALSSKAIAALDEGDISTAEGLTRKLEALRGDSPQVKVLKARVLFDTGRTKDAIAILDTIQGPTPDIAALKERMALSSAENPADLEKRLEKAPGDAFILGKLCSAYRTSDPGRALGFCRRASEADPNNINHAIGFGAALVQAKLYEEAVQLFQRLLQISPDNLTLRANLATALFQLKRYPEAKAEYRWITEKQPSSPAAYYFLGIVHDQLMEYMDAMANYQLFLKYADAVKNKDEIEKVNLRLPVLQKQIKDKKGKRS